MENNVVQFPIQRSLTPEQTEYWEQKLQDIEVARTYALRMLGRVGISEEIQ